MGSAPILRQSKFKVGRHQNFSTLHSFLQKQLGLQQRLYLYINSTFAPTADETLDNLFNVFAIDGVLIVNYSTQPAYG